MGEADFTVYFRYSQDRSIEIAGWYIDDGLLAANSTEAMDKMVSNIKGSFDIQDLGEPDHLLGIRIFCDRDMGMIYILQLSFILTIPKQFNISPGRQINSPMDAMSELHTSTIDNDLINIPSASLIRSINYCSIATRPNISFAMNKCAQFTLRPNITH